MAVHGCIVDMAQQAPIQPAWPAPWHAGDPGLRGGRHAAALHQLPAGQGEPQPEGHLEGAWWRVAGGGETGGRLGASRALNRRARPACSRLAASLPVRQVVASNSVPSERVKHLDGGVLRWFQAQLPMVGQYDASAAGATPAAAK